MRRLLLVLSVLALPVMAHAEAQPDIESDAPRVFSIQPRPYRLGHEFSLGVGVLPLDAFYKGAVIGGSYTYHFSDFWAWEMANIGYSLNVNTGLEAELLKKYNVRPVDSSGGKITLLGTTNLIVKPLFGKLSLFNLSMVYAETYFIGGMGPVRLDREGRGTFYYAADLGAGIRFWMGRAFSLKFEVRDYLIFNSAAPMNGADVHAGRVVQLLWRRQANHAVVVGGGPLMRYLALMFCSLIAASVRPERNARRPRRADLSARASQGSGREHRRGGSRRGRRARGRSGCLR